MKPFPTTASKVPRFSSTTQNKAHRVEVRPGPRSRRFLRDGVWARLFSPSTGQFPQSRSIGTSIYNRSVARRLASITAFLALMQAFFMAPYQHVHIGSGHERHGNHAEATIVHAHPYAISFSINPDNGPAVGHSHKPHASLALDTFTTLAQGIPFLFFQPESPVHIFAPAESFVWVEVTEPCGHDPPCIENTIPRAPPF